ncbi:hypothetical protein G3N95_25435 [Paraburkholderia sp. Tr-20389]|uniref:hypothetical protein n=1 Tax=Paraburkholderia sp. Tr-20389 TaxID=2703903 RepID=UPI00197DBA9C|nr:hypothetical protein [Paraburkholderia sp. Tr-20389]MBN3756308.1 hypothetical protein [Paraburkholderia sp. Tr-20389]
MAIASIGARGFDIFPPEVPGGMRPPGHDAPPETPRSPHENENEPERGGTLHGDESTAGPASSGADARPPTSNWPTAYAMNRLPTRYGPSKENRNVMVDYEHPGKTQFIIVNGQAYPVKNEGGQYRTYDPDHPERPSYGVSLDHDGQWQISQGLKGGGQDPYQSAPTDNNPPAQPGNPPQQQQQPPQQQPMNVNNFLGWAFGMHALQQQQQQGGGANQGQGGGGGNAGQGGAPGNPAQGGAGGNW